MTIFSDLKKKAKGKPKEIREEVLQLIRDAEVDIKLFPYEKETIIHETIVAVEELLDESATD